MRPFHMTEVDSVDVGWGATMQAEPAGVLAPLWQVNTRGRKVVEMPLAELLQTYKSGKLTMRSLVWSEGMPEWAPIGEVSKLMRRLRTDSEPPASGARLIGDDETPLAATKPYSSSGSEPPTDPGTLAIYERPLAMIEFPTDASIEPVPESVDEPTPAFGSQPPSIRATLPGIAPEDLVPISASEVEPAPPPLPPRPHGAFPTPVSASPLGAALSSMVVTGSRPAASSKPSAPPVPGASYAVAKATSVPSTANLKLPASKTPLPVASPSKSVPATATTKPSPPILPAPAGTTSPAPVGAEQKLPHDAVPAPPPLPSAQPPLASPPRPAIEFLPAIIVQEKEDDGASIIRMPLEPPVQMPLDAQFNESTLVLAGRRRPKRWVPLGAAIAAVVGGACLASAVTALMVRTRPTAPRIVEKRVLVSVPAGAAPVAAPTQEVAATRTPAPVTTPPSPERASASSERTVVKSEPKSESAPPKAWHKDDPGALEATQSGTGAHRELRAGFPTNPGF
jgi:hypothetical protein